MRILVALLLIQAIVSLLGDTDGSEWVGNRTLSDKKKLLTDIPDVFLIGAMKCGTTSLHKLFKRHPDFCNLDEKEKHWFNAQGRFVKGAANYESKYKECSKNDWLMDATPSYIRDEETAKNIKESYSASDLRKKKFILSIREPVARHFSEYQYRIRNCLNQFGIFDEIKAELKAHKHHGTIVWDEKKKPEPEKSLKYDVLGHSMFPAADSNRAARRLKHSSEESRDTAECERVCKDYKPGTQLDLIQFNSISQWLMETAHGRRELGRGHYRDQIASWLKYIPRDQIFIMNFDSLIKDTPDMMYRLTKFLNLDHGFDRDVTLPIPGQPKPPNSMNGYNFTMDCTTYDMLAYHYSIANEGLVDLINGNTTDKLWLPRPKEEPPFPPFQSTRSKCIGTSTFSSFLPGDKDVLNFSPEQLLDDDEREILNNGPEESNQDDDEDDDDT